MHRPHVGNIQALEVLQALQHAEAPYGQDIALKVLAYVLSGYYGPGMSVQSSCRAFLSWAHLLIVTGGAPVHPAILSAHNVHPFIPWREIKRHPACQPAAANAGAPWVRF